MPAFLARDPRSISNRTPMPVPTLRQFVLDNLGEVEQYPTLSDTVLRVLDLSSKEEASVAEAANVVRRDGVLAARVLRAANSCRYRGRAQVEDVQQAVLRLGMRECLRLLSFAGLREVYENSPLPVRTRCDALLRHSLFVARLASGFARLAAVSSPALAFTAGLLHDIGRVVLCVKCAETAAELPHEDEGDDTLVVERAAYGIDHCATGFQFATHNNLPEAVLRTVLNHHSPEEERLQRPLVALIAVAERVACHVQQHHTIADYALAKCPRFAVLAGGWGKGREETFRVGLPRATVQAIRDTRLMLKAIS